jgi:hypothetical protein
MVRPGMHGERQHRREHFRNRLRAEVGLRADDAAGQTILAQNPLQPQMTPDRGHAAGGRHRLEQASVIDRSQKLVGDPQCPRLEMRAGKHRPLLPEGIRRVCKPGADNRPRRRNERRPPKAQADVGTAGGRQPQSSSRDAAAGRHQRG